MGYSLSGTGSLSFYGPAETSLGVSVNWHTFTATLTGNVSLTLTVPAGVLSVNGQALPAGNYTITTSAASLSGSGTTSSPNFAGSVAITATAATLNVEPGAGTLSVGGAALDPTNGATLGRYNGTISVSANEDGTDLVSLSAGVRSTFSRCRGQHARPLDRPEHAGVIRRGSSHQPCGRLHVVSNCMPAGWRRCRLMIAATSARHARARAPERDLPNPDLIAHSRRPTRTFRLRRRSW